MDIGASPLEVALRELSELPPPISEWNVEAGSDLPTDALLTALLVYRHIQQ